MEYREYFPLKISKEDYFFKFFFELRAAFVFTITKAVVYSWDTKRAVIFQKVEIVKTN